MMLKLRSPITALVTLLFCFYSITPVFAQNSGYLEDEGDYLWQEQQYRDSTGMEFETTDSQYVGEQELMEAEEAARRAGRPSIDLAAALEKDKELLPDNIVYGIGTGVVLGGWLALVQGENARDNVRFVSIGVIGGLLLGMAVGSKSLYIEQGPTMSQKDSIEIPNGKSPKEIPFQFGIAQNKNHAIPTFNFQFRF